MLAKDKAKELVDRFIPFVESSDGDRYDPAYSFEVELKNAKQCALVAVENEYKSLREMFFTLRACRIIESDKTYLVWIDELINEEKEIKQEINKL